MFPLLKTSAKKDMSLSSDGDLWETFPSEDEDLYLAIPPHHDDHSEPEEEGDAYEDPFAKNPAFWPSGPEPDIDPEDDISSLIAEYNESSNPVSTQASSETKNNSSTTSSNTNTRKRLRNLSAPNEDTRPPKIRKTEHSPKTHVQADLYTPYCIAHCPKWQRIFDQKKLPFGVQWEITRLVSVGKVVLHNIKMEKLDTLVGSNADKAPKVEKILVKDFDTSDSTVTDTIKPDPFAKEKASKSPYAELDREEEVLNKGDKFGCLGCKEDDPWYGGKVAFRGKIKNVASKHATPEFAVELERPELSASYRFARRFGSSSFLRLRIPKDPWNDSRSLIDFLKRPFVLCGFVYRAIFEKDKNVIFFRTGESLPSVSGPSQSSLRETLSLEEFIELHNPLQLNKNQTVAKWASRFALGLSTSVPGLKVSSHNIFPLDDIISPEPHKSEMTDGSGLINQSGLRLLHHSFNWDEWPTAIQCRIAGAKGMLLQHPNDNAREPRVWIRPSQTKIQYAKNSDDDARLIIDVLRSCHSRTGRTLGAETIINLAENGVPHKVFFRLFDQGLDLLLASLTTWEGDDAMYELWCTLARLGGVMAARAARLQPGLARVKGHSSHDAQVDDDEDNLEEDNEEASVAWWVDEISGQPSSLEETVMSLLDSGFTPLNCSILRDKLSKIIKTKIRYYGAQRKIDVAMTCMTFVQPDPYNILEEGQVFFKSACRNLLNRDGLVTDTIIGPVLVTRSPCKLPTDVQKWEAIDCPQLRDMTGIIFFSTRGSRRAADFLGGGDYDGDKVLLIYDPSIVDNFTNADIKFADPRMDIERDNFSKHTETVSQLLERAKPTNEKPLARVHASQEYLLGGLKDISLVGEYSNMHDHAIYTLGYSHPETIRLGHMFCRTLDSAKTGLIIRKGVLDRDKKKYKRVGAMHWKRQPSQKSEYASHEATVKRPPELHQFIMDTLVDHAKRKTLDVEQVFYDKLEKTNKLQHLDEHLIGPWKEAKQLADRWKSKGSNVMHEDLAKIECHVKRMYDKHREMSQQNFKNKSKALTFTELPIETRQNRLRAMSKEFVASPTISEVMMTEPDLARLRASFAYLHDYEMKKKWNGWTRFPWDVAMGELCAIKAKAIGPSKTVEGGFYQRFTVKSSSLGRQ